MKTKSHSIAALAALLLGAGCATAEPVVRLSPRGPVSHWAQGRAVMHAEQDGVQAALAYDRNLEGRVAFRLEIFNASEETLLLDPASAWASYDFGLGDAPPPTKRRLADPEKVALDLEVTSARDAADQANSGAFIAGLLLLDVAGSVASGGHRRGSNAFALSAAASARDAHHEAKQARYASALEFWQTATFRRTSLRPGEAAAGLILADALPQALSVTIHVPVGERHFRFVFAQRAVDPDALRVRVNRGGMQRRF